MHLVGSDEQSFMYYGTHHMYWLADTQLMQLLIERLAPEYPPETQTNAADILAAIAHTQPSPLASKLSSAEYMQMLFKRALVPECANVLVPTLNVCIALLEPKRVSTEGASQESGNAGASSDGTLKATAVMSILNQIPRLIDLLKQEVGILNPFLGLNKRLVYIKSHR